MSRTKAENEVRSWGFNHVFTWTDRPPNWLCEFARQWLEQTSLALRRPKYSSPRGNAHYPPHAHDGLTTHLITKGELTITYPKDEEPKRETFGPGAKVDVDAKQLHEVWVGPEGCTYVIGE